MNRQKPPVHVSLVAIPDALVWPLTGLYEVLNSFESLNSYNGTPADTPPFHVEIVAPNQGVTVARNGLPIGAHRAIHDIEKTDIVIVPSMTVSQGEWVVGRYPRVVQWMTAMHKRGAMLCSSCSGVLLLAETGLLDGLETTIHWAYAPTFRRNFPRVTLRLGEALVIAGDRKQFAMSGASASWQDLVLYLIARHVGPTAAQALSKFLLLQWHASGQAPFVSFSPPTDHGDAVILSVQEWLRDHYSVACPVEEMVRRSSLSERSFKRRFTRSTGYSPIAYVQHLRIEEAKHRLERTDASVDDISWAVGYEDPAFFRRLFKRITRLPPGAYRRKFRVPKFTGS